jgi:hypothetical protein
MTEGRKLVASFNCGDRTWDEFHPADAGSQYSAALRTFWVCRKCGYGTSSDPRTLGFILSNPEHDCEEEEVRDVMES